MAAEKLSHHIHEHSTAARLASGKILGNTEWDETGVSAEIWQKALWEITHKYWDYTY